MPRKLLLCATRWCKKKKKENVPRGGVRKGKKKKTKVGRGPLEQCVGDFCSAPRGGVKKTTTKEKQNVPRGGVRKKK